MQFTQTELTQIEKAIKQLAKSYPANKLPKYFTHSCYKPINAVANVFRAIDSIEKGIDVAYFTDMLLNNYQDLDFSLTAKILSSFERGVKALSFIAELEAQREARKLAERLALLPTKK